MRRVRDQRLHRRPAIRRGRNALALSVKILTVARTLLWRNTVILPLAAVWRVVAMVLVTDVFCTVLEIGTIFNHIAVERWVVYLAMLLLPAPWFAETLCHFPLGRLVMGRRIRIKIKAETLWIGGWLWGRSFRRDLSLMFGLQSLEEARDDIRRKSREVCLVVGDSRRVRLWTVYGIRMAEQIVENANMALQLAEESSVYDIDPITSLTPSFTDKQS